MTTTTATTATRLAPPGQARVNSSSAAVLGNTILTSVLGLLFWVLAARLYPSAALGRDALLIAVMQAIVSAADLNLNSALPRLLPQLGTRRTRFVIGSYGAVATVATVVGVGFVVLAPRLSHSLAFLGADPLLCLALVGGVVAWSIFALQDNVLVAVRRSGWVPFEGLVFGVSKLVLVVVFAKTHTPHGIFFAWILPAIVLTIPVNLGPVRLGLRSMGDSAPLRLRGTRPTRTALLSFLAYDYGSVLVRQGGILVMAVLIVTVLGPVANALYSVCFTCVGIVEMMLLAVGNALIVEAAAKPDDATMLARTMVRRALWGATALTALSFAAAPYVLSVFGPEYAHNATTPLRVMLLAAVPQTVIAFRIVLWRLDGHSSRILWLRTVVTAVVLAGYLLTLHDGGLVAAAWSWTGAHLVFALCVVPSLWARLTERSPA